jgi:recombinational DNA repair ATPase RecF
MDTDTKQQYQADFSDHVCAMVDESIKSPVKSLNDSTCVAVSVNSEHLESQQEAYEFKNTILLKPESIQLVNLPLGL